MFIEIVSFLCNNSFMSFKSTPIFDEEKCTLLLPVSLLRLDLSDIHELALKQEFEIKEEFHITVIGFSTGEKIKESIQNNTLASVAQIKKLIEATNWECKLKEVFFHIIKSYEYTNGEKETRESFVQLADVTYVETFFSELQKIIGTSLPVPPPHITLYTKGNNKEKSKMGIGINDKEEWGRLNPQPVLLEKRPVFKKIIVPTRPQADTLVAFFLLKKMGVPFFKGIENASVEVLPVLSLGSTEKTFEEKGNIIIDVGGGKFDHHGRTPQVTASELVASYFGMRENPAISKLLEYARRDDIQGQGTISSDPLDRAFGLSGLVSAYNKSHQQNPETVIDLVVPLLDAHYREEIRRTEELPKEFEQKMKEGKAEIFTVKQRDKKLKVVMVDSDNASLPGYLRSQGGGRFDVVAQWMSSGHMNILTRPTKRIDLRSLTALIRKSEAMMLDIDITDDMRVLSQPARLSYVPQWYYDPATNSLQNGGLIPKDITTTKISKENLRRLLELGLSEELWRP